MLVFSIEVPNGKVQSNNSTSHENCFLREQGEERLDSLYERHGRKSVSPFDQWGLTIPAHSLPGAWYFLCISKETSFYTNTSLSNDRVFYILGGVSLLVADGWPPLQFPRACKTMKPYTYLHPFHTHLCLCVGTTDGSTKNSYEAVYQKIWRGSYHTRLDSYTLTGSLFLPVIIAQSEGVAVPI